MLSGSEDSLSRAGPLSSPTPAAPGFRTMNDKGSKRRRFNSSLRELAPEAPPGQFYPTIQELRVILDATTEGYGHCNVFVGDLYVGDRWLTSTGFLGSDLLKMQGSLKNLVHADDRNTFESALEEHLAGKTPTIDCELRLRTKAGLYKWFELRGKVIRRGRQGTPMELAGTLSDIHARKRQQHELVASHEQLSAIFQAAEDCISVVDPVKFGLLAFNRSFENMIFKARGIRVRRGMRPGDLNPEHAEGWIAFFKQVLEQGNVSRDYDLHSLDATHHVVGQCLVHDGRIQGICIFGHDITDRKRMEQALRKSEEKFAKAFREGPLALSITSTRDNRYIEVNDAFTEATGYSREELIGKTPFDIGLWVRPEQRIELEQEMLATSEVRNIEFPFRAKSGENRVGLGSMAQVEIDGEPCMLGVAEDITERKRTMEALRESEERLRLAVESGRMYAFEWNPATDIVRRSKQAEAILQRGGDAQQHTKRELIEMIHPDDRESYIEALKSPTADNPAYRIVFRLQLHDGSMLWLEESGRAFFQADDKMEKVVGMTIDVTEFREAERALRELSGRLISSQEEERCRIARELHDQIGQQLALVCMQAQRLASGRSDLECALRNDGLELYRRLQEIATNVSKLSHRLHSSELDFLGLATAAERLCRDFENQYGIVMDYVTRNLPAKLSKEKSRCFYRVLQEALQNVAKHSRATRVLVELEARENQLVLKIKDNGVGFDMAKGSFLSGLGLVSIRERLNLVGGRYTVGSKVGSGTTLKASAPI